MASQDMITSINRRVGEAKMAVDTYFEVTERGSSVFGEFKAVCMQVVFQLLSTYFDVCYFIFRPRQLS